MPNRPPTLKDVARQAGVSQATVSYVLQGNPGKATAETRARILQAVEDLGYRRDPRLSSLINRRWSEARSGAVRAESTAILLDEITLQRPFLKAISHAALEEMQRLGYLCELMNRSEYGSDRHVRRVLYSRNVRGILVHRRKEDPAMFDLDALERLQQVSIVTFGSGVEDQHHAVLPDYLGNARKILRRMEQENVWCAAIGSFQSRYGRGDAERTAAIQYLVREAPKRFCEAPILELPETSLELFRRYLTEQQPELPPVPALYCPPKLLGQRAAQLLHRQLADMEYGVPQIRQTVHLAGGWTDC